MNVNYKKLVEAAKKVKKNAYSPYSKFKVGAAVLSAKGKVYTGVNVENASFGLTVCAERVAINKAVSEGELNFKAVAIVSDSADYITPCGSCRQVLHEFAKEMDVVISKRNGKFIVMDLSELLPVPFDLK